MSDIIWPEQFLPGVTDIFIANETIVSRADAATAWPLLADTRHWSRLNPAVTRVETGDGAPLLSKGAHLRFHFGDTPVQGEVTEFVPPAGGQPGRLAWHGRVEQDGNVILDAYCAWLIEDLAGGRLRVVWHETLNGAPAREMAVTRPHPALAAHQEWVEDIAASARAARQAAA